MKRPRRRSAQVRDSKRAARERHRAALELSPALSTRLESGHPWVYKNQIPASFEAATGSWVHFRAGSFAGYGLWDNSSQIALRVFSRKYEPTREWVATRVHEAWLLRVPLLQSGTDAFRLIFGEGDGLPGIVVDYYAGYCLVVTYSDSVEVVGQWVAHALMGLEGVRGVVRRSPSMQGGLELMLGRQPPSELLVREGSVTLAVDLAHGQKTGLFLDHRDNRKFIAGLAKHKRVLNLFCYTGAFSLAALAGGARHVTSVDIATPSVAAARRNFRLNGYDPNQSDFEAEDVFAYLERIRDKQRNFDLVISDPPSFAKRREQVKAALKAYRRLSVLGLRVTAPGGLYAAASCTSQVSSEQFRQMLVEAAQRANRRLQLLHEAFHAIDHPSFIGHSEGRYLKFLVARVLEPC